MITADVVLSNGEGDELKLGPFNQGVMISCFGEITDVATGERIAWTAGVGAVGWKTSHHGRKYSNLHVFAHQPSNYMRRLRATTQHYGLSLETGQVDRIITEKPKRDVITDPQHGDSLRFQMGGHTHYFVYDATTEEWIRTGKQEIPKEPEVEVIRGPFPADPDRDVLDEPREGDIKREHGMTFRYIDEDWLVQGEEREGDDGNTYVKYRALEPHGKDVHVCDVLGGHVGVMSLEEWLSWPLWTDELAEQRRKETDR